MSAIGSRRYNAAGHPVGWKTNGAMKIEGQFIPFPADMLGSPAWRALSLSAHRVIARVCVEHGKHGGFENGQLPVTFNDFEQCGMDRHAVAPAIRECVALGFLAITRHGRSGNGEFRHPNVFRVTFLPLRGVKPTHDWRRIETDEQAEQIAQAARKSAARSLRRSGGRASRAAFAPSSQDIDSGGKTPTVNGSRSSGENPHREALRQWGKPTLMEVINPHWDSESVGGS